MKKLNKKQTVYCIKSEITTRQRLAVSGVIHGLSNKQIAKEMGVSEQAVKNFLTEAYKKANVKNRVGLMLKMRGVTLGAM